MNPYDDNYPEKQTIVKSLEDYLAEKEQEWEEEEQQVSEISAVFYDEEYDGIYDQSDEDPEEEIEYLDEYEDEPEDEYVEESEEDDEYEGESEDDYEYEDEDEYEDGYDEDEYEDDFDDEAYEALYREEPPKELTPEEKKKRNLIIGAIAAAFVLVLVFIYNLMTGGVQDAIQSKGNYYVTGTVGTIDVLENADSNSNTLARLENGTEVALLDDANDEFWYISIASKHCKGYISRYYLTEDPEAVTTPSLRYVNVKEGKTVDVWDAPGEDGKSIGKLERSNEVTLIANLSGDYKFVYSSTLEAYGYVEEKYLDEKIPKQIEKKEEKKEETRPEDFVGKDAPPEDYIASYYVNDWDEYLSVRRDQSYSSDNVVGKIYPGSEVYVIKMEGEFWYVYAVDIGWYGFVSSTYLQDTVPEIDERPGITLETEGVPYKVNVSSGYLALRTAKNSRSSSEIGQIPNGEEVVVVDKSDREYWYVYVPCLDDHGFVNSLYLEDK